MTKVEEDITASHRFGSIVVRYSMLSMTWVIFDGLTFVNQHSFMKDALDEAKELSGIEEPDDDMVIPIPPVNTDLTGFTMSPEVAANLPSLTANTSPIISSGPSEPSPEPVAPPSVPVPPPAPTPAPAAPSATEPVA